MTQQKSTFASPVRTVWMALHVPKAQQLIAFVLALLVLAGCKKTDLTPTAGGPPAAPPNLVNGIDFSHPIFVQDRANPDAPRANATVAYRNADMGPLPDGDYSDELPVVLGPQLANPYTRDNMAAAYNALYGTQYTAADIPVTHYYIKFTPADNDQLAKLDEETELDLYTHPLDHELIQDGDYYAAPGKTPNDIPELYSVVAVDDTIPNFAPHTVLAALHIPPNDDLVLEEIAESQAAQAVYYRTTDSGATYLNRSDVTGIEPLRLPECYNEGANPNPLDSNPANDDYSCGGGGGGTSGGGASGGGGGGVGNPVATRCGDAPLGCTESRRPRGRIRYWDTQLGGTGRCVALQTVKVIGKNWFKGVAPRNHMYTDANGVFVHNKKFKRVKVNVHFRNAGISIRPLRIAKWLRLSIFTLKSRLGVFRNGCEMNTIDQLYERPTNKKSLGMEYWTACHVLHGFDEYKAQAQRDELKPYGNWRLKYYIQRDDIARTRGPESQIYMKSYLHNQQEFWDVAISITKIAGYALKSKANALNLIPMAAEILRQVLGSQQPDIVLQYNTYPGDAVNSLENMSSSELCKEIYSSFTRVGLMIHSKSESVKAYFKRGDKYIQAAISAVGTVVGIIGEGSLYKYIKKFEEAFSSPNVGNISTVATQIAGVNTWITTLQAGLNNGAEEFFEVANGFGEYYGHKLCDRKYGLFADAFFNEKRQLVSSSGTGSHYKYMENWAADVDVDEQSMYRVGFFNDLEDNLPDDAINFKNPNLNRIDGVSNIKLKDIFRCIIDDEGPTPHAISWAQFKLSLVTKFPAQATQIDQLCIPYRIP